MTAFTYPTLSSTLQTWLEDNGDDFAGNIDTIISLGQVRLVRDLNLDFFKGTSTGTFSIGANTVARPVNCLELEAFFYITVAGQYQPVFSRTQTYCLAYSPNPAAQGLPRYYWEESETLFGFVQACNQAYGYSLRYLKRPDDLTESNPTNWLATNAGDMLLYACLVESEKMLMSDERVAVWQGDYAQKIKTGKEELINLIRAGESQFPMRVVQGETSEIDGVK